MLGAFGGARPTGLGWLDAVLLGLGGVAASACGVRARTIPLYLAAAVAAVLQPATVPLVLGGLGIVAAITRRWRRGNATAGALAGGLAWAAAMGAPAERPARLLAVPLLALGWMALSARRHGSRRFRQRVDAVAIALGSVAVVGAGLGALAVLDARSELERSRDLMRSGLDAARIGDTDTAVTDLHAARRLLARSETGLGALWARPAWLVPGVSQNARALHDLVGDIHALTSVAAETVDTADVESLRASGGRLDLAAVTAVEAPLVELRGALDRAAAAVDELGDAWLLPPVRAGLDELTDELADAVPSVDLALEGVRAAPALLGGGGRPTTYLVLFTTPVEARATTGFPGNFAEVTFDDGRFDMTRFGRISELVSALPEGGGTISGPPDYLARYGRFRPAWEWRNLPLSPDFPTVAAAAAELYPQSGGRPVDGVLSVDPTALAAFLQFTGPIAVPGLDELVTASTATRLLLRDQYVELPDTPERIDVLETLARSTFDRLQAADLPGPRELGRILGPVVEQGHLQVASIDEAAAGFLDHLGISGRYPAVRGDFVGVTTSNAAGSKIDLFARRSLDYDVRWDPTTGALAATATITLTNDAPEAGLPAYIIGNALGARLLEDPLPDGWNRTFVTLYTPWELDGATLDGAPLPLERMDELGRHALSTFVSIPPGGERTLVIDLAGVLPADEYRLDLASQPLVTPESATVQITVRGGSELRATGPITVAGNVAQGSFALLRATSVAVAPR